MGSLVTSNPFWKAMKKTLDGITTEDHSKNQVCIGKNKLCVTETMEDGYADDIETAGTTFLTEKEQGQPMASQTIIVGGTKRYIPRTLALKIPITEEAMEDCKYKKIIDASKRLQKSAWNTQDIDVASLMLAGTTSIQGYDQVALFSTSHVLAGGGNTSNCLISAVGGAIVGMTPSQAALQQMRVMARLMPGPNGIPDGKKFTGITFPELQLDVWKNITGCDKSVDNNFNNLNTTKDYNLDLIPVFWYDSVSTTFWAGLTDAEDGIRYLVKRPIRSRVWVDNDAEVAFHSISYRADIGVSNWRAVLLGAQ